MSLTSLARTVESLGFTDFLNEDSVFTGGFNIDLGTAVSKKPVGADHESGVKGEKPLYVRGSEINDD